MINIIFFISLFLILLIVIPITFKGKISYSVLDNLGSLGVYVFGIKVFHFLFLIKDNSIIIKTKKHKKEIEMEISNEQIRFVEQLLIQLKQKIYLKNILIDSKIGLGDAFNSAILSATLLNIFLSAFAFIKNSKKYAKIEVNNFTAFNEKVIQISGIIQFSISIFDILYCLFMSLVITRRSDKYETI